MMGPEIAAVIAGGDMGDAFASAALGDGVDTGARPGRLLRGVR